jgi:hypothetical protein
LTSVSLPISVEVLCTHCFMNCSALRDVQFEDNSKLPRIERGAFFQCSSLVCSLAPSVFELGHPLYFASTPGIQHPLSKLEEIEYVGFYHGRVTLASCLGGVRVPTRIERGSAFTFTDLPGHILTRSSLIIHWV